MRASDEETDGRLPLPSVGSNNSGHVVWWLRIKALDIHNPYLRKSFLVALRG